MALQAKPMLVGKNGEPFFRVGSYVLERKYDGTRILLYKEGSDVRMESRSDIDYAKNFPHIIADIRRFRGNVILDGELVFFKDVATRKDFFLPSTTTDEKLRDVKAQREQFVLLAFDIIQLGDDRVTSLPYHRRKQLLKDFIDRNNFRFIEFVPFFQDNKEAETRRIIAGGGEGVVLKEIDSPYREGIRSKEWIKVRRGETFDVVVVGFTPGEGARKPYFGALVMAQFKNGKLVYIGKVGTGFDFAGLEKWKERLTPIITEDSPLDAGERFKIKEKVFWVEPKYVIEVGAGERHPESKVLRFPKFLRDRDDKALREAILT